MNTKLMCVFPIWQNLYFRKIWLYVNYDSSADGKEIDATSGSENLGLTSDNLNKLRDENTKGKWLGLFAKANAL